MRRIINKTNKTIQRHTILFQESEIILTLRYYPRVEMWAFDTEYANNLTLGRKLSVGVLHMVSENQPFDFIVTDRSSAGIDPFRINDFSDGRCYLYLMEASDMVSIRNGAEVPVD